MDLTELEKKVARLMPRRLRRSAAGEVVEAAPSAATRTDAKQAQSPPITRPPRTPQPVPAISTAPVTDVELRPNELEPGARDVRERLLERGASPALADRIVRSVLAANARGAFAIDAAAAALSHAFDFERAPRRVDAPHVLVFVGPTGAGKTSTFAKLGRRLAAAGREVFFATLDPLSASAFETTGSPSADVDRTELPLRTVRDVQDLHAALVHHGGAELVLLDTPGLSPRDEASLADLQASLATISRLGTPHVYLVMPASASRSALGLATRAFARLHPSAAVITKLDETTEPGAALEEAQRTGLPLGFFCDGQDVRGHLVRASADRVADLFLRGRLA